MYVLGLMARIADLFGHGVYAADGSYDIFYVTMIKLPSIIADIGSAYLVYRLARKKLRFEAAYLLMCLAAFCPVFIYVSGGWGQIDQILSILLVISIILLNSNKPILAGFVYGLSILLKPQALMAGPLLAIAYFCYIFDPDFFSPTGRKCADGVGTRIMKTVAAVACACALLIVSVIPFADDTMPWYSIILQKYMGTATSYKYASVNAYNIYTLFGKNWTPITEKAILGLTYGQLGTVLMVLSVGFGGVLYSSAGKAFRRVESCNHSHLPRFSLSATTCTNATCSPCCFCCLLLTSATATGDLSACSCAGAQQRL